MLTNKTLHMNLYSHAQLVTRHCDAKCLLYGIGQRVHCHAIYHYIILNSRTFTINRGH